MLDGYRYYHLISNVYFQHIAIFSCVAMISSSGIALALQLSSQFVLATTFLSCIFSFTVAQLLFGRYILGFLVVSTTLERLILALVIITTAEGFLLTRTTLRAVFSLLLIAHFTRMFMLSELCSNALFMFSSYIWIQALMSPQGNMRLMYTTFIN